MEQKAIEILINEMKKAYPQERFKELFGGNNPDLNLINPIQNVFDSLDRIKLELNNNLYFIIVVGGVKSGKSSLINLFAGAKDDVAITRPGQETTIFPSIISYTNTKDEIVIYKAFEQDGFDDPEKALDSAIDHVKEFYDDVELKSRGVMVTKIEFNPTNIEKYVASMQDEAPPLLINIRIKADNDALVSQNIAIIDTPGLDGTIATHQGVRKESDQFSDQFELTLLGRTDYILFMQSSVTPLNVTGLKFIDQMNRRKQREMLLVHNKFTLKEWRQEGGDDNRKSAENTRNHIIKPVIKKEIGFAIVDIAKAQDGKNSFELKDEFSKDELYEASKFEELKQQISETISKNGKKLHLQAQNSELDQAMKKLIVDIKTSIEEYKKMKRSIEDELSDKFKGVENTLEKYVGTNNIDAFTRVLRNDKSGFNEDKFLIEGRFDEKINTLFAETSTAEKMTSSKFNLISGDLERYISDERKKQILGSIDEQIYTDFINHLLGNDIESSTHEIKEIIENIGLFTSTISRYEFKKIILNNIITNEIEKNALTLEGVHAESRKILSLGFKTDDEDYLVKKTRDAFKDQCRENDQKFNLFVKPVIITKIQQDLSDYFDRFQDEKNKIMERLQSDVFVEKDKYCVNAQNFLQKFSDEYNSGL